jgi:G3E family GTPase
LDLRGRPAGRLAAIFVLGGLQGLMGWIMVASGFADRTDVSQYRLVAHLLLALVIYGALLWSALDMLYPTRVRAQPSAHQVLRRHGWIMMAVITLEIAIGGFVAGLDGGLVYNNFPMMGEHWIAPDLFAQAPWWSNFFENPVTAQFLHRLAAGFVAIALISLVVRARRAGLGADVKRCFYSCPSACQQAMLGIATLMLAVPAAAGGGAPGRRLHPVLARPLCPARPAPRPGVVNKLMSEAEGRTNGCRSRSSQVSRLRQDHAAQNLPAAGHGRPAVVINEFGEIGLDHLLVEQAKEDTILMSSGCLCCSIRGDLIDTLRRLYKRRERGEVPRFKRLVIETTGLADPAPILQTLIGDPLLSAFYRLDGVVTTVDAVNGMDQLDRQFESVKQAAVADRLVLTKTDLAKPEQRAALEARLQALNPAAPLLPVAHGAVAAEQLFNAGLYNPAEKSADVARWLKEEAYADDHRHDHHGHDHHHHHDHAQPLDVNRHDDHVAPLPGLRPPDRVGQVRHLDRDADRCVAPTCCGSKAF